MGGGFDKPLLDKKKKIVKFINLRDGLFILRVDCGFFFQNVRLVYNNIFVLNILNIHFSRRRESRRQTNSGVNSVHPKETRNTFFSFLRTWTTLTAQCKYLSCII